MAFTYGVKLPGFNNKKIQVNEITSKLYKDLVKSLYNNDTTEFIYHLNQVIEHVSPGILQEGLNVVDKIMLLLQARSICISPDLNLKATCPDTKKEFDYTIKIEDLIVKLENINYTKTLIHESITITHSIIKAKDEIYFVNIVPEKKFSYQLASCIDSITVNDKALLFKNINFLERVEVIEKLPLTLATKVIESLTVVEENITKINLLKITSPYTNIGVIDLPVSTDTTVLLEFCKLIFNDDLINLYKLNLNLVSKANFSAEYVDGITPAEQLLYWTLFVQQTEKENSAHTSQTKSGPGFDGKPATIPSNIPNEFA